MMSTNKSELYFDGCKVYVPEIDTLCAFTT